MTVQQLFEQTVGIMGLTASNAVTYQETLLPQVNTILGQLYDLENNLRRIASEVELTETPSVSATTDILPYKEQIIRRVAIWGLAQLFALTDDDTIKAGFYGARFAEESINVMKLEREDILDYYSGETYG